MIPTHATTNYRDDLYAFLSSPPIEGFRQDPYFDSVGLATIGVGFNIEGDRSVQRYVLNQLGVFAGRSDQEIENIRQDFENTIASVPNGNEVQLVNNLNAKLRQYLGAQTTTLFTLDMTQSRAIFEQILGDTTTGQTTIGQNIVRDGKQKELDATLSAAGVGGISHDTNEYVALMSLFYNQRPTNPLIGPKLLTALQSDYHAEAWYEIRYNSNGGASQSSGIASRRYAEAQLFGLYNGPIINPQPDAAEAKAIFQMYTTHRETIVAYKKKGVRSCNRTC
jgi:GH24 family phage-related lysozyme (muramidase)